MLTADYRHVVDALRVKARDSAVTPEERDALNAKADELAEKITPVVNSPEFHVTRVHEPPKTALHVYVQWSVRSQEFPDDWYTTADEWWDWDTGSMAE